MDMTRAIILEENTNNDLWLELLLAIMYMKNNWPIRVIQNLSPNKAYTHKLSNLSHLGVLGSTIYIFLYKEEQMLESEKWAPKALKGTVVGYNSHKIFQVHFKDQKKVIWVKIFVFLKTIRVNSPLSFLITVRILLHFKDFFLQTTTMNN